MANILSKYNSLDAASKKQVRDLIDQLMDKKGASKKQLTAYKKNILLISTWCEQDKQLIAKWSEKDVN
jgi:site-specific recombinase XerD